MRTIRFLRAAWPALLWLAGCASEPAPPAAAHTDALAPAPEAAADEPAIRGRVASALGGLPVAGAQVRVERWDEPARAQVQLASTTSAADGTFALDAPTLGAVWVEVEATGFGAVTALLQAPPSAHLTALRTGAAADAGSLEQIVDRADVPPLDFALTPGVTAAIVVHGRDGAPRAGLDVTVETLVNSAYFGDRGAWSWNIVPTRSLRGRTGADGACSFSTVTAGAPFQVRVLHDGKPVCEGASPMGLRPGERRAFDFAIGPYARIAGRAVDPQGAAVAGQELWLVDPRGVERRSFNPTTQPVARTTSAADGAFVFEEVPEGEWLVGPAWTKSADGAADPGAVAACALRVELAPGAAAVAVDVPVWRGLFLSGRVLDQGGAGMAGLLVRATAVDDSGFHYAATSDQGDFAIGPLSGGSYELGISDLSNTWRSEPFVASAGEHDVELRLARAGRIRCVVVDPAGAEVHVQMTTAWTAPGATAETDCEGSFRDGAFELAGLGPGRYQVLALDHEHALAAGATVDIAAGEQRDLRLALQPAAELILRNSGAQPVRIACSAGGGLWRTYDLPPAAWVDPLVPPGPVEVRVTDATGAELARRELTIASGVDQTYTYPAP